MAKHRLIFDITSVDTIADSDSVGAFVRSSDGTLVTHQTIGSQEALDVAAAMFDGTGNAITSTGGALDVNVTNSLGIDVDLDHTEDSVRLGDGTNFLTSTTVGGDIGLDVNIINTSVAVSATDLDIRDLTAASDSVESWLADGSGNAITSSGGALDVNLQSSDISLLVQDVADTAILATASTITGTSGVLLSGGALSARKYMLIYNNGNRTIFLGPSGVDTVDGYPVFPGSEIQLRSGPSVAIHAVASSGSQDVRVLELS